MILDKFSRMSRYTGQVTVRKLDSFLKATSTSARIYNPYSFCKKQFANNPSNQTRYLSSFSDVRYMHSQATAEKQEKKTNIFVEHQLVGCRLLETTEAYANCVPQPMEYNENLAIDNVEELLNKPWISMTNSEIMENFEQLSHYAFKHNANIEDEKFHGVLEVLKTRCTDFSDSDIRHLFKCLQLWNFNKEEQAFTDLWKAFEDEILKRFKTWTIDEILLMCHLFFKLRISRTAEFTWHGLKKIGRKPQLMNRMQLIHLTYLMRMNRKLPINLYNIEYYIEQNADKLSLNELGIFAAAFYQYETPIRSKAFIEKILDKLIAEMDTVNELSLGCLMNILRLHHSTEDKFVRLLQELERVFPHLSLQTLTIAANSQKKALSHRESLMIKITERFESEIKNLRTKQMDVLMTTLATLGYDANAIPFCSAALRELVDPRRATELERFPKILINIIGSSLLMNHFTKESEELCNKIFDPEFIHNFCKDDYYYLNREYLEMYYCLELDHPEYTGHKLDKQIADLLCKSYGSKRNENIIRRPEKSSLDGMQLSNVDQICQKALQSESAFYRCSVLPHFTKAFGIICYDPETKEFGSPSEQLSKIPWNLPKYAPGDGRKWFALVTASIHQIINFTNKPVGKVLMQMRHLEKIGYEPIFIPYYEWESFSSDSEKEKYVLDRLQIR